MVIKSTKAIRMINLHSYENKEQDKAKKKSGYDKAHK